MQDSTVRLYKTRAWKALRLRILERDHHACFEEGCDRPAVTVDHILPAAEAEHLFFEPSNLRASCPRHNYGRSAVRAAELARVSRSPGSVRRW